VLFAVSFTTPLQAGKDKPSEEQVVDSGTFVVMVRGQRSATESFRIVQGPAVSTATAEFRSETGDKVIQKAELQVTSSGELRRYEWRELSPGKEQIVVEPSDQVLVEQIVPDAPEKPVTQRFILPPTTMILDDYLFSHREVLAWRYLAQVCGSQLENCRPGAVQFIVLAPRRRLPALATLENAGPERVQINGKERQLNRLTLKIPEEADWVLYMDLNLKLIRITIPAEQTEIVRTEN
jgi:hypothetical protein